MKDEIVLSGAEVQIDFYRSRMEVILKSKQDALL